MVRLGDYTLLGVLFCSRYGLAIRDATNGSAYISDSLACSLVSVGLTVRWDDGNGFSGFPFVGGVSDVYVGWMRRRCLCFVSLRYIGEGTLFCPVGTL